MVRAYLCLVRSRNHSKDNSSLVGSPGRFFASMELKAILAYLVMNYDMELEGGAKRPDNWRFGFSVLPNREAAAVFRKRQAV